MYKYGKAIRYSVRIGWRMIILFISLNSFQSSSLNKIKSSSKKEQKILFWKNIYFGLISLTSGSNLGPPGIATLSAFAVKNDFKSNK